MSNPKQVGLPLAALSDSSDQALSCAPWKAWYVCSRLSYVGPAKLNTLATQGISPSQLLSTPPELLKNYGLSAKAAKQVAEFLQNQGPIHGELEQITAWLDLHCSHHVICIDDEAYPIALKLLMDPPPVLFAIGDIKALAQPQVAVIGSRNASISGQKHATRFSEDLCRAGLVVTSGLALGIDAKAHQGALNVGGVTVAVLATGVDNIYPRRHQTLAFEIIDNNGVIISENPLGTPPIAPYFPRRNRIISGLSLATLVVEASLKSGSLTTAQHALNQGRDVFALPCGLDNTNAAGNLQLLRQGALLVTSAEDIISEVAPMISNVRADTEDTHANIQGHTDDDIHCSSNVKDASPADTKPSQDVNGLEPDSILDQVVLLVTDEPVSIDYLRAELNIPPNELNAALAELELDGILEVMGDRVRRS